MTDARPALDRVWGTATTGLMTPGELIKLYEAARRASGPGVLVEVGSWAGTSALVILAGRRDAGEPEPRLYCIDTFEKQTRRAFEANLGADIRAGAVVPLVGRSLDFARTWPPDRRIKFLFLDGDHTYHTVREELERFTPFLEPGAIVVLHDCFYRPEPCRAFQVYFADRGVSRAVRGHLAGDRRFGHFEREWSLLAARYQPVPALLDYPEEERAAFRAYLDRQTALHSPALKAAYGTYLLARAAKEAADRLHVTGAVRRGLALLGVRRLFGRPVRGDRPPAAPAPSLSSIQEG